MTKLRAPAGTAQAMHRAIGVLGIEDVRRITRKSKRWVQACAEEGCPLSPTVEQAVALDQEYAARGGQGFPFLDAHALRLEVERPIASTSVDQLLTAIAAVAKECGEAVAAGAEAARDPGCPQRRARAILEADEGLAAIAELMRRLKSAAGQPGTIMHFAGGPGMLEPPG